MARSKKPVQTLRLPDGMTAKHAIEVLNMWERERTARIETFERHQEGATYAQLKWRAQRFLRRPA